MPTGYCTVGDVRRALRSADLPGDVAQDRSIAIDAIAAQTKWFQKTYHRHWYVPGGLGGDTDDLVPTAVESRDDEHDLPTYGGFVVGASEHEWRGRYRNSDALLEAGPRHDHRRRDFRHRKEEIRIATGDVAALDHPRDSSVPAYTRITLARKDVDALSTLNVVNESGGYDDWTATKTGGVGNAHRGEDYWVRVNNGGVSELYLDVHAMDDDIATLSNAVYVEFDYGHAGLPRTARRGIAFRAAADLVEEAVIEIPQNTTLYDIETKAEELRAQSAELLSVYETELET